MYEVILPLFITLNIFNVLVFPWGSVELILSIRIFPKYITLKYILKKLYKDKSL